MPSDLNLYNVSYQSALRSKPVRDNFTDIQNFCNLLKSEVYASIASTASEITTARDNYSNLADNIRARKTDSDKIYEADDYEMSVSGLGITIQKGSGIVNGIGVYHSTYATISNTVPSSGNKRYDVLVLNTDNSFSFVAGTPTTGTAQIPTLADTQMPLSRMYLTAGTTDLTLTDLRYQAINPIRNKDILSYTYSFSGNTLASYTGVNARNESFVFGISYSGATMASIGATIDGKRYTETYSFSGNTISSSISLS